MSVTSGNLLFANDTEALVVELTDMTPPANRPNLCHIGGKLTNKSFGSITVFNMSFDIIDDRGDRVSPYGGSKLSLEGFGRANLSKGLTSKLNGKIFFETKCEYIRVITSPTLEPRNCNMKMLPENRECEDHLVVMSYIPNISIK